MPWLSLMSCSQIAASSGPCRLRAATCAHRCRRGRRPARPEPAQDFVESGAGCATRAIRLRAAGGRRTRGSAPRHRRAIARHRSGRAAAADLPPRPARSAWRVPPGIDRAQVRFVPEHRCQRASLRLGRRSRCSSTGNRAGAARCRRAPSPARCRRRSRCASGHHAPPRSRAMSSCRCRIAAQNDDATATGPGPPPGRCRGTRHSARRPSSLLARRPWFLDGCSALIAGGSLCAAGSPPKARAPCAPSANTATTVPRSARGVPRPRSPCAASR